MNTLKFLLRSLISNETTLEGRKRPLLLALGIFFLSMIVAVVPTIITVSKTNGSDILKTNMNSADIGMAEFVKKLSDYKIELVIEKGGEGDKAEHVLVNKSNNWATHFAGEGNPDNAYQYISFDNETENVRLSVYYRDESDAKTSDFKKELMNRVYVEGSEKPEEQTKISSFMILGREHIHIATYAKNATSGAKPASQMMGDYSKIPVGRNLMLFANNHDTIMERWTEFLNSSYQNIKINSLFLQVGLFVGINVLIVIFMGLMIFIMTRGKNNPFRHYKLVESLKVAMFAALAPAIITVAVGSFIPLYASMIFMLTLGMRVMWLSSKNLRPAARQ